MSTTTIDLERKQTFLKHANDILELANERPLSQKATDLLSEKLIQLTEEGQGVMSLSDALGVLRRAIYDDPEARQRIHERAIVEANWGEELLGFIESLWR